MTIPFTPFIEELKIDMEEGLNNSDPVNPRAPEEQVATRLVKISKDLLDMGFNPEIIFPALQYFEVQDLQSAADLLIKTSFGWPHSYVRGRDRDEICEVCGEGFDQHIESQVYEDVRDIARTVPLPIFGDKGNPEPWRTSVECKICMEGIPIGHEFHLSCRHMHCEECVANFLKANIDHRAIMELQCPEENCGMNFTENHIRQLCSESTFQKYVQFRNDYEVSTNKKLRWCPMPNCGRYVENVGGKSHVKCECDTEVCFDCGGEWEAGHRCKGSADSLYKHWAKDKNIQLCPRCKIRVEKDEGCNHMTCSHCHYQWCWVCGDEYTPGHYGRYFFGCPFVQYTEKNWSLMRIMLYNLLIFLVSPLLSLGTGFMVINDLYNDLVDRMYCRTCRPLIGIGLVILYLPLSLIVGSVMMLPTVGFRFYGLIRAVDRAVLE